MPPRDEKNTGRQEDGQEVSSNPKAKRSAIDPTIDESAGEKAVADQNNLGRTNPA